MADTLDVISLTAAKVALNIDDDNTDYDAELARQITAVSRVMDEIVGPVVVRTITTEEHLGNRGIIALRRRPVTSITTVREVLYGAAQTVSAVAFGGSSDGYRALKWERNPSLLSGLLRRRRYGCHAPWGDEVEVTYVAGRYANTAAVDARFVEAAAGVLRRLWKREAGTWAQSASVFADLDASPGSPFFRAVEPVIRELIGDEVQTDLVGFA